ncbi:MAG: glutathione S-transferase, partial [Tsuneonella sp.]
KLDLAEQSLVEGPWVFGDTWTLSDGYLMVFERWSRQARLLDPARFPKLNAHLDQVQTRDAVKAMLDVEGLQPV